jgi:hypothetical protein
VIFMNPHKIAWYNSTQIGDTRRPDIRARFRSFNDRMYKHDSGKTKWERIGKPLFVDTPLDVAEFLVKLGLF